MEGGSEYKKGLWTVEEDRMLMDYIRVHGKGRWSRVAKVTGLKRCGKSCRLRWMNYLSPGIKRGDFSEEEDDLIIRLHNLLGNRWSLIAGRVPGRTDNQVKNHWNSHLSKKLGIKKGKRKVGASSQALSVEAGGSIGSPSDSNSMPSLGSCGAAGQEENKGESQRAVGLDCMQEPTASGSYESSFWLSNDDLNLYAPTLMELLDEYSLDFVWDGL